MAYQPLTREQFESARKAGFSTEKIIELEKRRKTESGGISPQSQEAPKPDALARTGEVLGSIFGGEKIGKALGQVASKFHPEVRKLAQEQPEVARKLTEVTVTPKEIVGDILKAGTTIGAAAIPGAGTLAGKVAQTAAIGGLAGGAEALREKEELPGIVKGITTGAAIGGALPIAGKAITAAGKAILVHTPRHLANLALRTPLRQQPKELGEAFLKRKLGGKSLESIRGITAKEADQVDEQIGVALQKSNVQFSTKDILKEIAFEARKSGTPLSVSELKRRVASTVPTHAPLLNKKIISAVEANRLRIALDRNLRAETAFGPMARPLSVEQRLVKSFDNALRRTIQAKTKTSGLFKQQSEAIGISKLAEQAIAKTETQGALGGLLDLTSIGLGALVGGAPGAVAGPIIERAIRTPQFRGGIAQLLRAGVKPAQIISQLGAIPVVQRVMLLKAITAIQENQ